MNAQVDLQFDGPELFIWAGLILQFDGPELYIWALNIWVENFMLNLKF